MSAAAALLVLATSCGSSYETTTIATDSVSITRATADSAVIVELSIDYPQKADSKAADSLREQISVLLRDNAMNNYNDSNSKGIKKYAGDMNSKDSLASYYTAEYFNFLSNSYKKDIAERMPDNATTRYHGYYTHNIAIKKVADTTNFVSCLMTNYWYTGGAHGSQVESGFTLSKDDGSLIGYPIDTLKVNEMQPILRKGLLSYFNNGATKKITDKELNDMLFINGNTIPLPATAPYFTPEGIKFTYQQYEIAPYASGLPEFTVPYAEIKPYVKEGKAAELVEKCLKEQEEAAQDNKSK